MVWDRCYRVDTTPPLAALISGVELTNNPLLSWSYTADPLSEPVAIFRTAITTSTYTEPLGAFTEPEPFMMNAPEDGEYTFSVGTFDEAGNFVLASFTTILDTTPPAPPLVTGVPLTNDPRPLWEFGAGDDSEPGVRFLVEYSGDLELQREFDAGDIFQLNQDLSDGLHTLTVRTVDAAGNTSEPVVFETIVDTTPPSAPTLLGTWIDDISAPTLVVVVER